MAVYRRGQRPQSSLPTRHPESCLLEGEGRASRAPCAPGCPRKRAPWPPTPGQWGEGRWLGTGFLGGFRKPFTCPHLSAWTGGSCLSPWGSRDRKWTTAGSWGGSPVPGLWVPVSPAPIAVARSPRTLAHSSPSSPAPGGNPWGPQPGTQEAPSSPGTGSCRGCRGCSQETPLRASISHPRPEVRPHCASTSLGGRTGLFPGRLHGPPPDPLPLSGTSHPGRALGHLRRHPLVPPLPPLPGPHD